MVYSTFVDEKSVWKNINEKKIILMASGCNIYLSVKGFYDGKSEKNVWTVDHTLRKLFTCCLL